MVWKTRARHRGLPGMRIEKENEQRTQFSEASHETLTLNLRSSHTMNSPLNLPIILPINANPMLGHIGMEQLHILGVFLMVGFVAACAVIGWKALHTSSQPQAEEHVDSVPRDLDKAA
jgi:hypothetical protein